MCIMDNPFTILMLDLSTQTWDNKIYHICKYIKHILFHFKDQLKILLEELH